MAEPGTTAGAALGALAATMVALLGVEPQALIYASFGAFVGLGVAPKTGALRSVLLFGAVALISAACGTYASTQWGGGGLVRNLAAAGCAAVFHPVFAVLIEYVPGAVRSILDRLFARKGDKP